jgi:hypothetical protein
MAGWRRSADRTSLQANCLLKGNFTGKFAILRLWETVSGQETAVTQRLFTKFPAQSNREHISINREFSSKNKECMRGNVETHQSSTTRLPSLELCDDAFPEFVCTFRSPGKSAPAIKKMAQPRAVNMRRNLFP